MSPLHQRRSLFSIRPYIVLRFSREIIARPYRAHVRATDVCSSRYRTILAALAASSFIECNEKERALYLCSASVFLVTLFSHSAACALFRPLPCSDCFLSVGSTVLKTFSFSPNEENLRVLSRSRLLLTRNAIVVRFSFHLYIPFSLFLVLIASFSFQREPTLSLSLLFQAICHRLPLSLSHSLASPSFLVPSSSFSPREKCRRWKRGDGKLQLQTRQRQRRLFNDRGR